MELKTEMHKVHTGWAVRSIKKALNVFNALGYEQIDELCGDTQRKVNLVLMRNAQGDIIELVEPMGDKSPISNLLETCGPTPYHFCFSTERGAWRDLKLKLREAGLEIIQKPSPAPLLNNKEVVFLYSPHIGLVEFVLE